MDRKEYKLLVEGWQNYLNENEEEDLDDFHDFDKYWKERESAPNREDDPDYIEWGEIGYMPIGKFGPREGRAANVDLRKKTKPLKISRNPIASLLSSNFINYDCDSLLTAIERRYEKYFKAVFNNPNNISEQVESILNILTEHGIKDSKQFIGLDKNKKYDIVWEIIDKIRS